jgi:hypothetical protein
LEGISCASIVAIERLRLRGRVTGNHSKLRGFPRVCGNPVCELCARLGPAIVPDNTLRESFSPAGTTHPCLLQTDSVDVNKLGHPPGRRTLCRLTSSPSPLLKLRKTIVDTMVNIPRAMRAYGFHESFRLDRSACWERKKLWLTPPPLRRS